MSPWEGLIVDAFKSWLILRGKTMVLDHDLETAVGGLKSWDKINDFIAVAVESDAGLIDML